MPGFSVLPTADELRGELAGLQPEILRELRREIHEGQGHQGMSEVVQMRAVKE